MEDGVKRRRAGEAAEQQPGPDEDSAEQQPGVHAEEQQIVTEVAEMADTLRRVADRGRQIQAAHVLLRKKNTGHGFKIEPTAEVRRGQDAARGGEG